jgi:hypothetical protein
MRRQRLIPAVLATLSGGALVMLTACPDRPIAAPTPILGGSNVSYLSANLQKDVDVLFMIDNSPSMSPKQAILAQKFASFIQVLDASGANYHVGIVTSDCGAVPVGGTLSGSLGPACDSMVGENGALQAVSCNQRPSTDFSVSGVQALCGGICPTDVLPVAKTLKDGSSVTANFLASTGGMGADTNVPSGTVAQAFACMAFVGDQGCGIEMPLESVKRALDGKTQQSQNAQFLRQNALLAIIFITDEDDCSVSDRTQNDPSTMDCTGSANPGSSCYNPDYRCFAMGAKCAQPLNSAGNGKGSCTPTTGSYLYDVSTYTSWLDGLGKLQGQILVDGIVTPDSLAGSAANQVSHTPGENAPVDIDYTDGAPACGTPALNRSINQPTCQANQSDPVTGLPIVGKPEVRLAEFIQHYNGQEYSVCDVANYDKVLTDVANHIVMKLGKSCIPPLLNYGGDGGTGTPSDQCQVAQVDSKTGSAVPIQECMPGCCNALAADPMGSTLDPSVVAACGGSNPAPCWCAVQNPTVCTDPANPTIIGVVWGSSQPLPNSQVSFACQQPL